MNGHLSDLLHLLKNGQKLDSFSAHFEQHLNSTLSHIELRRYMTLKLLNQINPIGTMKTFTKPNCNLLMEEGLTILKKLQNKSVAVMNVNLEIYDVCRQKTTFRQFFLITADPI